MRDKLLLILIIVFVGIGCNEKYRNTKWPTNISNELDSLIDIYMADLRTNPEKVKESVSHKLKTVEDSLSYHKLSTVISSYHYYVGNLDSSILVTNTFLHFLNHQKSTEANHIFKAKQFNNLGTIYNAVGQRDSAISSYRQAIEAYYQTSDHSKLPVIYINLADAYNLKGDYPNAASAYRQTQTVSDSLSLGDQFKHAIYNGLGRIYTDMRNFPMADSYFKRVEDDWEHVSAFDRYFFSNSRSTYYYCLKDYDQSLKWLYQALEVIQKFNSPVDQAVVEGNLGEVFLLLHQTDSAKHYLDKAAAVFLPPAGKDPSSEYYLNGLLASYYLQTDNLSKAEQLLTKPYEPSRIVPVYVYYNDKRLEELYNRKGDYSKAYSYRKRADLYDDSIRNVNIQNNITEIEMRYRQDTIVLKRDVVIANQQKEVERVQSINMLVVAGLVIVLLAFAVMILFWRRKREKRFARQMDVITTLRMDNLRNRVSPHFMYNVLHAVLPTLRQQTELARPLELLDQSVQDSLLTSGKVAIPLKDEISIVKNYIHLYKSIGSLPAKIEWNIGAEVHTAMDVPSMIIQIPVENALKYAFERYNDENFIRIEIEEDLENIRLVIEDNGIGFKPASYSVGAKGTGNGIKILYKTIELLNEQNREKILFSINSTPQVGTKVSITIPLNYKYTL